MLSNIQRNHKIVVENAKDGEKFTTLDGEERTLDSSFLMIKDSDRSVALAGIMGGLNSEIQDDTKRDEYKQKMSFSWLK